MPSGPQPSLFPDDRPERFADRPDIRRKASPSHAARVAAARTPHTAHPSPVAPPGGHPPPAGDRPRNGAPAPPSGVRPASLALTGEKARARDILAAIRALKALESEHRPATSDERDTLARFGGFGAVALSLFPDPRTGAYKPGWDGIGGELESLLTPEEYASAKRTTFSQYFTAPAVMEAMHDALELLGVTDSATILEPGCGVGHFLSHARPGQRFIGVELDSISGRIARALHPDADIRIENFRDTKLPALDAVIGNVPFGDVKMDLKGDRLSLHDFFIAKATAALKPGGVLAVVTSHFSLDKQNASARERLAEQADFLGAIRLPSDAFKREGTEVVTDILFLRKRASGQEPAHADADWLHAAPLSIEGADVAVNRYFLNHPEMVLGTWSREDTLHGAVGFSVKSNGDLASRLKQAVASLPGGARNRPQKIPETEAESHVEGARKSPDMGITISPHPFVPPPPLRHITEGSFFVADDRVIHQVVNGRAEPVVYCGVTLRADGTPQARKIAALIGLRDDARRVLQSQNEGWPEAEREKARRDLNRAYDRFVYAYGPINKTTMTRTKADGWVRRMPNLVKFREDPDAMLVMALEEYDEATGTAKKAPILLRDVVGPKPPIARVTTAEEGLLASLDRKGAVDLEYIAELYGRPEAEIVAELGDLIYRDPGSKQWQTADAYLSGNVRQKLAAAEAAGPSYARNAEALRQVQPEDVLPGDIDANLGAPWIPAEDIRAFAEEMFGGSVAIGHLKKDALWSVDPDYHAQQSVASTADYGTPRISGIALFEHALNLKAPAIYDVVMDGTRETRVLNPVETMAAKEKQKLIKEKFKGWVFADADRTERLVRIYNDAFNNLRPRVFDGSHLDFPGMSKAITLRPHQEDAVWRCMTGGNTLLAHVVGAGKSFEISAACMKLRQAGLAKKCLVAVPNHLLEQFAREFQQLYPNAKVLIANKDDFTKERRKALTAKIATGDWDAVVVTHSGFERIGMSKEYRERFLREQISEYEDLLISCAGEGRNILKSIEKQKARREEKLKDLLADDKKDSGLVFDELGVDQVMVDECFPYDTLIATDRGPLRIGDIVTKMLPVCVKSVNVHTKAVEWKPVVNWYANKRRHPLVEVIHEKGAIRCTAHHKLIAEHFSHRQAGQIEAGEALLALPEAVPPRQAMLTEGLAEVLLDAVPDGGPDADGEMRGVCRLLQVPEPGPGKPREAPPPVLRRELQDEGATGEPRLGGEIPGGDASLLGYPHDVVEGEALAIQGDETSGAGGEDARPQALGRDEGTALARLEGDESPAAGAGREWAAAHGAASPVGGEDGDGHGTPDPHEAHPAPDEQPGQALQGGPRRSGTDAGRGGGRQLAQLPEGAGARRQEGAGPVPSRVVGVAILQPGSDGEYRFGGRNHSVVYDIEVADNHNYFADGVLVSNCHAYKNLETPTKMDRVAGINTDGSERAFDLLMKSKYLDEQHPGHGLIGASGTPISNSMVEMYTMQRLFDPKGLEDRGIGHFDGWAGTFGEVVDAMEISPDGSTLKPRARFAKFVNLPELVQMFRSFADVQTAEMLDLPRPALAGGKPRTISCPMSDEQAELQAALVKRYERIRNERVDPREDNALNITTDGRKLALDARMLAPWTRDFPGSKINALVANVARIHRETAPSRGTQMIFCDMGVNANPFSAYDDVVAKLERAGIPRQEIAVIGDADTDAKKQALFERVRSGSVRVLIGSTQKMGTGTNVQKRLVALHHLDAPWKPAEVEQREGRILRQGNMNEEVSIYRYVTEGSFDAYMWQALETKARFIAQVMRGDCPARSAEDIGGQELSYAEVKAIASGNPAVLTLAEAVAELQRLAILKKNHLDEQYLAKKNLRDLPDDIRRLEKRLEGLTADMTMLAANDGVPSQEAVAEQLKRMPDKVSETYRTKLGTYRGLEASLILHPLGGTEVVLDGAVRCRETLLRDNPGPRAVLNALQRLANGYDYASRSNRAEIGVKQGQLHDYESRVGKGFAHADYMSQLSDLRDQLKLGLSEHPPEGLPPVAELAEKIKALREANTVEAAPERTVRKAARAERPVTARIRERMGPVEAAQEPVAVAPTAEPAKEPEPVHQAEPEPVVIPMPEPVKPVNGHAKAVAKRRQEKEAQLRLF